MDLRILTNKSSKYRNDPLGNKIKTWEENTPSYLPPNQWTIIRIDGHCFHTFTKSFNRPIDYHLSKAMVLTTQDLCKNFNITTGYTQSDEINLLIPPTNKNVDDEHYPLAFNGKKQKLESLTAGFASARFNFHLRVLADELKHTNTTNSEQNSKKIQKMISGRAFFDSRALTVCSLSEVSDVFLWRHKFDCYRNGISSLAYSLFSAKQLEKKNTSEKINMILSTGAKLEDYPPQLLYGTFVKKTNVKRPVHNEDNNNINAVIRTEYITINNMTGKEPDYETFLSKNII
jgi:tRNA(His) 5'-end guanylyltransferase